MRKIVVLDRITLGTDLDISPLNSIGEVIVFDNTAASDVSKNISDSEIVIINKVKLTEDNLKPCKNIKLICIAATGFDNIDINYCKKNNIAVCNVKAYSTESVTQLTIGMALMLYCKLYNYQQYTKSGEYSLSGQANILTPVYHEICGKTWGIVGLGTIGKRVADIAKALGCNVIAYKRNIDDRYNCKDIDYLLKNSDIISVHLPLTNETRGLISQERISLLKQDAVFINVARGAIVDEEALCNAIINKSIGGIGIDVYSTEPFIENSCFYTIKDYDNVILTPHMAWGAFESRKRCLEIIIENIKSFYNKENFNRIV